MNDHWHDLIRRHSKPLAPLPTGRQAVLHALPDMKAVLFDVYGTLLISASGDISDATDDSRGDAFSAALAALDIELKCPGSEGAGRLADVIRSDHERLRDDGIPFPEVDIVDVWGRVLAALARDCLIDRVFSDEESLQELALQYELRVNPVWPMPGCEKTLTMLRDAGLHLGIVSNSQVFTPELFPALLGESVEQLGFHPELQFYSYRSRQAKPGLFLFEAACSVLDAKWGIAAEQALYVGNDMRNDVAPAQTAGFRTALFAGDARSYRPRDDDPRVDGVKPDLVLTELDQLTQILRGTSATE